MRLLGLAIDVSPPEHAISYGKHIHPTDNKGIPEPPQTFFPSQFFSVARQPRSVRRILNNNNNQNINRKRHSWMSSGRHQRRVDATHVMTVNTLTCTSLTFFFLPAPATMPDYILRPEFSNPPPPHTQKPPQRHRAQLVVMSSHGNGSARKCMLSLLLLSLL